MDVSGRTTQETKSSNYRGVVVEFSPIIHIPSNFVPFNYPMMDRNPPYYDYPFEDSQKMGQEYKRNKARLESFLFCTVLFNY